MSGYSIRASHKIHGISASSGSCTGRAAFLNGNIKREATNQILMAESDFRISEAELSKYVGVIVQEAGIMSEIAIKCRNLGIPCLVNVVGIPDTIVEGDPIRIKSDEGILFCSQKPKYRGIVPEMIGELDISKLVPYRVPIKRKSSRLLRSTNKRFLASPETHVLIRKEPGCVIVYAPKPLKFDGKTESIIKNSLDEDLIWGGSDLYQDYTSILFGVTSNPKIRQLFNEIKEASKDGRIMAGISNRAMVRSRNEVTIAENLVKKTQSAKANIKDILSMFRHINNSAVYFEIANQVIPAYSLKSIESEFKKLKLNTGFSEFVRYIHAGDLGRVQKRFESKVNGRAFKYFSSRYQNIKEWKLESILLDAHKRRSIAWSKAARLFKEKTNHKVSEFLGQYGSGYKLEHFMGSYVAI